MKELPTRGSAEWFEQARRRCVDHLRTLLSLRMARDSANAMLQHWNSQSAEANSALHSSCVIAYGRPFTNAATKRGNIRYPTKNLTATPGFDKELHLHLLDLRNRLIAHSDYDVFPSSMYLQTMGDDRLPIALGINVKGVFGIESHDLALRYEKHLSICNISVEKTLNLACKELASEAQIHPNAFHMTNNLPDVRHDFVLDSENRNMPPPTGPAAGVDDPAFAEGLTGYRYITLTHQIALIEIGKCAVKIDGIEKAIHFLAE